MTPNAFTLPAQGLQIRQRSAKQIKQSATRVNRNEPPRTKSDADKKARIVRASI